MMVPSARSAPYDIAVVGAGPAGTAAALAATGAGLDVLLLEKMALPRYKTCGGGLVGRALRYLPVDTSSVVERECYRVDVNFPHSDLRFTCERDHPIVSMAMRDRLDALLAERAAAAGAELVTACPVRALRSGSHAATLTTDRGPFRARFVIGADGATGIVAKQGGWARRQKAIPALEYEVTLPQAMLAERAAAARFDFGAAPHGYGWIFPKATHLSVGVLTTRPTADPLARHLERYMTATGLTRVEHIERHGYLIPLRPVVRPFMRRRTLLVGDAAGFADPITAEGISFAILSGQLAARAIAEGGLDPGRVRRRYHALLRKHVLRELLIARRFARAVYEPLSWGTWLLERHGREIAERMTEIFAGNASYRSALAPRQLIRGLGRGATTQRLLESVDARRPSQSRGGP